VAPGESAAADDQSRHETLWERLLQYIEDGAVIPVVGQELLSVEVEGRTVLLYEYLAQRLAQRLAVAAPDAGSHAPLNRVACSFLETGGEPERIYSELQRVMKDVGALKPPEPLRQLAAIAPFSLFVSTTFDSLLAQALNDVRFSGSSSVRVLTFSPGNPNDAPPETENPQLTFVYHLLGRVSSMQDYVVTEEDALEFVHNLLFSARPKHLFTLMQKRQLLILGCSFPTWIVRFLIRASRESRLLLARGKMDLVVDSGTREDLALVSFLQSYKTRTEVFDTGTAIDFVKELHERWTKRTPAPSPTPADAGSAADNRSASYREGVVFLSYASEDRDIVRSIRDSLEGAGLDVFFDQHDIHPGDKWEPLIKRTIEDCALFMPVLSKSCLKRNRRFLSLEWKWASEEAGKVLRTRHFIVPIVLDDVPLNSPDFPDEFQATQAARLQNGRLSDDTIRGLTDDYRAFQRRRSGR
jgi:TIR domain/SIR2-like domain